MAISTHKEGCIEHITDSNKTKHYLNAEYLDGHSYADISNAIGGKGTVTSVATADGITGGPITASGTIKANLKSYTKNTAEIGGRLYGVELDKNGKLAVNVPWTDTNTDTKVTSAANHYTPVADSSAQLSVDASSTTAATWDKTALVTGVNLQRDSKGHVTGVTVDSIKMPANPNTHQAIKTLKTDNTAAQATSASEAIAGSGTINLHKVAKTGSYNDLNDKPTIPDISGLVPYDGATHDVTLVNYALVISDKTSADGAVAGIKVSGKGVSEDDVWTTIKPNGIRMESPSISYANLSSSELTISDGAQSGSVTENGFKVTTPEGTSWYRYDGILHDGKHLSLPEKEGTIALTSDLPSKLSQMDNDANYVKSTDNIDADTLAGKTYSQIANMINQKQNTDALLSLISDIDTSASGFLRVYMKPIEAPGSTHYTRVAELQNLPLASSSEYGMVKLGSDAQQSAAANSVSSTPSRTYAIQKDSSGNLVVNVPWKSLSDANANTVGGVKAQFGVTSGGEGNFELYADIQQGNNTLYIRAGQFQQTSGSSSSTTRFTFKKAMNTMGGSASYVAVILGDSYGQTTNGQWMGSLAVDGSDYAGFKYRAAASEKGHVYYIGIGRW